MAVFTVGTGQQFSTLNAAVAASHNGDTIYVKAGTYLNDFATITTNINIIGVGGMAQLTATLSPPDGKAILTTDANVHIDHLEFSGAVVPDDNGAGIRFEIGNLNVTNSYFHDNQMGILTAQDPTSTLTIDRTEFNQNGVSTGLGHNIYVGHIAQFTLTNSYSHDAVVGHEVKSRAVNSDIENNRIFDNNSSASYSVDLPDGGAGTIRNNIIQQGPNSENSIIISYGEEGGAQPGSTLSVSGNTIINQWPSGGYGVRNATAVNATISNNTIYGLSADRIAIGTNTQTNNHTLTAAPALDLSHPWAASPWDQLISGGAGNDTVNGTSGRDLFVGGGGNDTFNVTAGGGSDTIADFSGADVVRLSGYSLSDIAGVQAALSQNGADTLLTLGNGETLTFQNTQKTTLTSSNFSFGGTSPVMTPIENAGVTTLATSANHFYLLASDGSGPSLKYGGVDVTAGQFGGWTPLGAEKTASGYEIAWKITGADTYTIWNTDNSGNYTGNIGSVPGSNPALTSAENRFDQDLNGDGTVGAGSGSTMTPIESAGATTLATSANHYFLLASNGSGPSLKYGGADVTAGQFGGWTPLGAEKTSSGYQIAWKITGSDTYTIWTTDNAGNYTGNIGPVSGSSTAIVSAESVFQQDLNGDGKTGSGTMTPIESAGATTLATSANHFYLLASDGSGPSLKYGGTDFIAGQFDGWTPLGAEKTASGYEIAWKIAGADTYTLWNTDNSGNYAGNVVGAVAGADPSIISAESFFHQDLNGNGTVGATTGASMMTIQAAGATAPESFDFSTPTMDDTAIRPDAVFTVDPDYDAANIAASADFGHSDLPYDAALHAGKGIVGIASGQFHSQVHPDWL